MEIGKDNLERMLRRVAGQYSRATTVIIYQQLKEYGILVADDILEQIIKTVIAHVDQVAKDVTEDMEKTMDEEIRNDAIGKL